MPWSEIFSITWKWVLAVLAIVILLTILDQKREVVKITLRIWIGIIVIVIPMGILWAANGVALACHLPLQEAIPWTVGITLAWHVLKLLILTPRVMASICKKSNWK